MEQIAKEYCQRINDRSVQEQIRRTLEGSTTEVRPHIKRNLKRLNNTEHEDLEQCVDKFFCSSEHL